MTSATAVSKAVHGTVEVPTLNLSRGQMLKRVSPESFRDYTETARKIRREVVNADMGLMYSWAMVVANASDVSGFIGTDSESGQVNQGDYATLNGVSPAYVSKLLRLGRAILRFKVQNGTAKWAHLASENFTKDLSKVLGQSVKDWEADKAGAEAAFKAALEDAMLSKADRKALAAKAADEAKRSTGGETNVTESEAERSGDKSPGIHQGDGIPSTLADLGTLVASVVVPGIHRLSPEQASSFLTALEAIVKGERDRLVTLALAAETEATPVDSDAAPEPVKVTGKPRPPLGRAPRGRKGLSFKTPETTPDTAPVETPEVTPETTPETTPEA